MRKKHAPHKCFGCNKITTNKTYCSVQCRAPTHIPIKECPKCQNKHQKTGIFCSRACSNSRNWSEEDKLKKSQSAKKSAKVLRANQTPRKRGRIKRKYNKTCPTCKQIFHTNRKHCSEECFLKNKDKKMGGYRPGAGIGKSGLYRGIWCDSSWELAYLLYCEDHGIEVIRNKQKFPYVYEGIERKYIPDFLVNDNFVEIKGYCSKQWLSKLKQFPKEITVLGKKEMEPILQHVMEKYGNNFTSLYEHQLGCSSVG